MPRARNIKPGFFRNEDLAELPPLARLLFAGLWCVADREGRLEDRPKRIKTEVLPYDDCDADTLLQSLADADFIIRYVVGEQHCIQILNFRKHQRPHPKEAPSILPEPPKNRPEQASREKVLPSREEVLASRSFPSSPSLPSLPSMSSMPSGSKDPSL